MEFNLEERVIHVTDYGSGLADVLIAVLESMDALVGRITAIDREGCVRQTREMATRYGRIDGLVHTLPENDRLGLENGNYDNFVRTLEQHVALSYLITQAVRPWLKLNGGVIVNLVAEMLDGGQAASTVSAAINGGRLGLTAAWAKELSGQGIRSHAVVVGMNGSSREGESEVRRVAETIAFFLSPAAAGLQGSVERIP